MISIQNVDNVNFEDKDKDWLCESACLLVVVLEY